MQNVEQTIISQYANSPILTQLIANFDQCIDPQADLNAFYSTIWDVSQAIGKGLDIWGRIVGVTRYIKVPAPTQPIYFGFAGSGLQPFGQAPFYSGSATTNTYALSDDAFRTLILVKALANISDCTAPSFNRLLQNLFTGRGRCYVQDLGGMQMSFVFEFDLLPYELSIIANSGAFPRPVAVSATAMTVKPSGTFGFAGSGLQPFGQGTMFNGVNQITTVA